MGLRIFGALVAVILAAFATRRYSKGLLRRGELFIILAVVTGLIVAAAAPTLLDPLLSGLGFQRGDMRQIIGLLVLSNLFTLAMMFRSFSRDDQMTDELGRLVDFMALRRLDDEGWQPLDGQVVVVIPAYNEADNLPAVLKELPNAIDGHRVQPIVVADGCTDATEEVARANGAVVIRRDLRRGQGAAIRLGYLTALRANACAIVSMDADGQHDPVEMESLVRPILNSEADMVQGSRVLGTFEIESKLRQRGVAFFSRLLTLLSRTKITDPSNGYRAVAPEALRVLDLRQDQFFVSELMLDAAHKGVRVVEVPITVRKRASGTTKKGKPLKYAWGYTKAVFGTWLRQPPGANYTVEPRWLATAGLESLHPDSLPTKNGNGAAPVADREIDVRESPDTSGSAVG
jgi:hypothetical protein